MSIIYFADDDKPMRRLIQATLTKDGHEVQGFKNGSLLLDAFAARPSDIVLLDIMMPGLSGLETLKALRSGSSVPVLLLTACDEDSSIYEGVTAGADDYIVKPFRPMLLRAKIYGILRRVLPSEQDVPKRITCGNVTVIPDQRLFNVGRSSLILTPMEGRYLQFMMERFDRPVSREELLSTLWGLEDTTTRAVDEANRRLRNKLNLAGADITLESVWGFGYILTQKKVGE